MMILPSGDVTLSAWIQASALTVATFDHALESLTTPSLVVCSNTALPKRAVPALAGAVVRCDTGGFLEAPVRQRTVGAHNGRIGRPWFGAAVTREDCRQ